VDDAGIESVRATAPASRAAIGTRGDRIFHGVTAVSALLVLALIIGIGVSLFIGAWPALSKFGFGFLTSSQWNPVTNEYGALVAIFGTLVTSILAMIVAIPVSFGIAFYLTELAPLWVRRPVGTAIELLAAIPSIIYGMWGLFVLAPFLAEHVQPSLLELLGDVPGIGLLIAGPPIGIGIFTAGLILAIMVIPFITSVMRDTFEIVPSVLKESSYALGATTWEVMRHIVLPYTKSGVFGGIMLGLGRALGETMAVTFVIGNSHTIHSGLFYPGNSISAALANEFTEAVGDIYHSSLIALGLVLFIITLIVLVLARLLLLRLAAQEGN